MHSLHMDLAETAKCLAQRISESRVIDLTPAEASRTTSGWENHEQQFGSESENTSRTCRFTWKATSQET